MVDCLNFPLFTVYCLDCSLSRSFIVYGLVFIVWSVACVRRVLRTTPSMTPANTLCLLYRGTSLITNNAPLGPYSRNMPKALWWS